jgi:hypothetical protein
MDVSARKAIPLGAITRKTCRKAGFFISMRLGESYCKPRERPL